MHSHSFRGSSRALALVIPLLTALLAVPSQANDRPFQYARTAIEEDDEQVWSFESWLQRRGSVRSLSIEPEYAFTTKASLQVELTRVVDRHDQETGHEAEAEFKYIFNNIARDGWAVGVGAAVSGERSNDSEKSKRSVRLELPLSLSLWQGEGFLHINLGVDKANNAQMVWTQALGIEREVARHTVLFAELARDGELRYGQIGVRHWLKREKLAVDFSLQQFRGDARRESGFVIGLGWYDL